MRFVTLISFCFCFLAFAADDDFKIVPMQGRPAEEIIPILQSVFGERARFSNLQNKLVISSDPKNFPAILKLVKELDHKPRNLIISFRQGGVSDSTVKNISASGNVKVGKAGQVGINNGGAAGSGGHAQVETRQAKIAVDAQDNRMQSAGSSVGQLTILEGAWGDLASSGVNTLSGMKARARIQGEKGFILDFSSASAMGANSQNVSSSVTGTIDRWQAVGSVVRTSEGKTTGIGAKDSMQSSGQSDLFVKVSALP
jgi:hypothetical protein